MPLFIGTIVAVRQFLHTLFELLWYAGASWMCVRVCECVCLPHCALNGRDVWFTFLVCTKCKCDSYTRFCLPHCKYSCVPHCALPTLRDAAALVDLIVSLFSVAYVLCLPHTFHLFVVSFSRQMQIPLPTLHTMLKGGAAQQQQQQR